MTRPKITSPILAIFALKFVKEHERQPKLKFAFKFKAAILAKIKFQNDKSRADVVGSGSICIFIRVKFYCAATLKRV